MASSNFTYTQTKLSDTSYRLSVLPTQENTGNNDLITSGTVTDGLTSKSFTLVHWGVPYIRQFGSSPQVSAAGGRLLYNVYTHYPFVFRSVPTWVHISDSVGHQIQEGQTIPESSAMTNGYLTTYYVDVDENTGHSRDTYGTFNMGHYIGPNYTTLGERKSWIVIEQEAGEETPEYIYFNPTAITFDATANTNDTKQVVVNSSSRWNGNLVLYDTNKFTISPDNGQSGETTVTITYVGDYLPATGYRTQLNIYAIDGTSGMSITKASAATPVEEDYIVVSPRSFSLLSASTQGNSFSVSANTLWSATVEDDWIDLSILYGPSGYTSGLSFDTDANTGSTRQGHINFSAGTATDSISIEQQSVFIPDTIETNVTIIGPASSAGTQQYPYTFRVRSTADWTISRYPRWVTISPLTGAASTAYTNVSVSVSSNPGPSRSDYIQITAGTATPKVLNISQNANSNFIKVTPTAATFTSGVTRAEHLNVSASTDWRITSKPSWVTFRSTTAMTSQTVSAGTSGDTTVWFSVSENTGDTRSGSAAFALENTSYIGIWTVTQDAAASEGTLHIYPEDDLTDITSMGGVYSVHFENNDNDAEDWFITYSDDWMQFYYDNQCTLPAEYISAGQTTYLFLKVNQTDVNRSGAVIFTGEATGRDITLDIEQSAE